MNDEQLKSEVEFLRQECDRLRKERDLARKEREDAAQAEESESSIRLKLLSESLSREIKERFVGSLKSTLWVATLLLGVATAGGLWKLSDIIDNRVGARIDEKIKEKDQDVAQIRQQILKSVVDFERQAKKSLDDIETLRAQVARESDQATGEIRQAKARILAFEVSSGGSKITVSATAPEGSGVATWFGIVAGNTAAVAGSQADKYGFDDAKSQSGAFSLRFQRALLDPRADTNQDEQISVTEAVTFTRNILKEDRFDQSPTVAGQANEITLFSTTKSIQGSEKYKTVHAVIVGVSRYSHATADLRSAVNDAKGFTRLLENKDRGLFGVSNITTLLDEQATRANIWNAVSTLHQQASKDDLVVFYFSGRVASIDKDKEVSKVIFPTDFDIEKGNYIMVREVVEIMGKVSAKHALVVVDG
jgi:Caspase domain